MRATQAFIETIGGPEVIQWKELDLPAPGPGEILIRHEAVGLNYIDTYFRTGLYPAAMPTGLGQIELVPLDHFGAAGLFDKGLGRTHGVLLYGAP